VVYLQYYINETWILLEIVKVCKILQTLLVALTNKIYLVISSKFYEREYIGFGVGLDVILFLFLLSIFLLILILVFISIFLI